MFGQLRPSKAGARSNCGEAGAGKATQPVARLRRQRSGREGLGEILERAVPGLARLARAEVLLDRAEDREAEDPLGVDRVRIAPQRLDPRDAERPRTLLDRRAGSWGREGLNLCRLVERARPGEVLCPAPLGLLDRRLARRRPDALEEARGDGRLSPALFGAGENRLACAERCGEVVRGLADPPLRRRQPEFRPHRPVEEGVGVHCRGPHLFVEAGEQHPVEGEKARFEQAENGETRMAAGRGRRAHAGERVVDQPGVFAERAGKAVARRLAPLVEQRLERRKAVRRDALAFRRLKHGGERSAVGVEPLAQRRRGGEAAERAERRRAIARERFARRALGLRRRSDGGMGVAVFSGDSRRGEGAFEVVEVQDRRGAEDAEFERPRGGVAIDARAA